MTEAIRRVREAAANEAERLLVQATADIKASPAQLGAVEKQVRDGVVGIGAAVLSGAMRLCGTGYAGSRKLCACSKTQKYMNDRERNVVSLLGTFRFKRAYYWCAVCVGDAPMDRAFAIDRTLFSPSVRECVALLGAEIPFGRGQKLLRQLTGIRLSKRKHEEISEKIGASLCPVDATLQPRSPAGPPAVVGSVRQAVEDLYITLDGTMAPTIEAWREVKVGAIFHAQRGRDGQPQRVGTHYFGDIIKAESFGWRLYRDAQDMGLERAHRTIVVGDGAPWIWNLAAFHFPDAIQIVDWYHATERLWAVANAGFGDASPEGRAWVAQAEKSLKASRVETVIKNLARLRRRKRRARKIIDEAIGYFRNNAHRMRYRRYRHQGLFISSGVVEAGCKQSGMRWTLEGLRSILYLRLAILNNEWPKKTARAA